MGLITLVDWMSRSEDEHVSGVVQRRRSAVLHPLLGAAGADANRTARGPVMHEHVPKKVDVPLPGVALTFAEKIAGERLKRDSRSIVRQDRTHAGSVCGTSTRRAADELGRSRDEVMRVDVGGAPAGITRQVRCLRNKSHVPPIAADRWIVARAVRIATSEAAGDSPGGVRLRVAKVDVGDAISVRWLDDTRRCLRTCQVRLRHERDETAIGTDGRRPALPGRQSARAREVQPRAQS